MKKQFLNVGKALSKSEQGGYCPSESECVEFNSTATYPDDSKQFICMPSANQ